MTKIDSTYSNNVGTAKNNAAEHRPDGLSSFSSFLNEARDLPGSFSARQAERDYDRKEAKPGAKEDLHAADKRKDKSSPDSKPKPDINDRESDLSTDRGFADHSLLLKSIANEVGITPARSILHVGDLERIIASIRAHRVGDMNSITVSLKHSVFEGLEFRVIHEKGRGLMAEFIASSESVRIAVQDRSAELVRLFADRGIQLGSLNVSLGNKQSGGSDSNPRETRPASSRDSIVKEAVSAAASAESRTSYLT